MKKRLSTFSLSFLAVIGATPLYVNAQVDGPKLVCRDDGAVYYVHVPKAAVAIDDVIRGDPPPVAVWRGIRLKGDRKARKVLWEQWWMPKDEMLRWRIEDGRFWAMRLGCFFKRIDLGEFRVGRIEAATSQAEGWAIKPIGEILFFEARSKAVVHIDLLPQGKDDVMGFLLWKGKLRAWSGKLGQWEKLEDKWDDRQKPMFEADTELKEAFIAFQHGSSYFFVTKTGKVHSCPRKGQQLKTKLLWDDADRPVTVLVNDTASGKTFAFTARREKTGQPQREKEVFFELAEAIKPAPYDPSRLPEFDAEAPLERMGAYVDLLVKEKKIPE